MTATRLLFLILAWGALGLLAAGQAPNPPEKVTLQYRTSRDAFAPSKFVAVLDGGVTAGLELNWDLPKHADKEQQAAQEKAKKDFDGLIQNLENRKVNGVEFECQGDWLKKGLKLRVATVPRLTEAGTKRIKDSGN